MDTVKLGFGLTIRYLAGVLMSFVIFLSFIAVFTLPLTEAIGYDAYVTDETGHSRKVRGTARFTAPKLCIIKFASRFTIFTHFSRIPEFFRFFFPDTYIRLHAGFT